MKIVVNLDHDLHFHGHLLQELDGQPQCDHFGENCCKFRPWPTFHGHLLQELDGQPQCDHFGENLIKIGWMVSAIFNVSVFFQVPHFQRGKWRLSAQQPPFMLFYRSWSTLIIIRKKMRISWTICEKTDYVFSIPSGKDRKGSKILRKKKDLLSPAQRIEDSLQFCNYLLIICSSNILV